MQVFLPLAERILSMYIGEVFIPIVACLCKNWGILKQVSAISFIWVMYICLKNHTISLSSFKLIEYPHHISTLRFLDFHIGAHFNELSFYNPYFFISIIVFQL